jgi:type IV pilus assembly protein PilV
MFPQNNYRKPFRLQKGVGLIEVMISVLIMGIGLLGIAAMQATALRNNQSALERTQATIQSYSILDAMRANRIRALAGDYNLARTCTAPGGGTLAQNDLSRWIGSLRTTMGDNDGSCGTIVCNDVTDTCRVTVEWDDSRASDGLDAQGVEVNDANRNVVTTVARL